MIEALITLVSTTVLLLGSPGPAPIALAATGATFGFRKGIPFLFGILTGIAVAITAASIGLAALFNTFPQLKLSFQIIGGVYILYIAYKIASASAVSAGEIENAPKFIDGFILNLLNPKLYAVFLAIYSKFLLPADSLFVSYLFTGLTCFAIAVCVDILWLAFGRTLRHIFHQPKQARQIRILLASLMVIAVFLSFIL